MKTVLASVALALVMSAVPVVAQTTEKIPKVGFLSPGAPGGVTLQIFRQGLAKLGYVEGQHVLIEPRFADGEFSRFPQLTEELVGQGVDAIAMVGAVTARAAKAKVTDIPLVFAIVVDPVAERILTNPTQPDANITGITNYDPQQQRKRLEVLKEMIPGMRRIGVLGDSGVSEAQLRAGEAAAKAMGLQPFLYRVGGASPDLDGAFSSMAQDKVDALLVLEEPVLGVHRKRVGELAAKTRIPTMFTPLTADSGGLAFYGTVLDEPIEAMAATVTKILSGAKPSQLPVETVIRYKLFINMKTARQLGVPIPAEILMRADRIIE